MTCPIMLFALTLADRAILPTSRGGSYFFNRISQFLFIMIGRNGPDTGISNRLETTR